MSDTPEATTEVDDDNAAVAPEPEPTAQSTKAAVRSTRAPSPAGQAVSGDNTDDVHLCHCIVKNVYSRKSLSVHHVQRRLIELGFAVAAGDKDGWYGDSTISAVKAYQAANGLAGDGTVDAATLDHLFADDPNVVVAC